MQTKIYKNTFKGCSNIRYIKLPTNISAIDDCAFQNCSQLASVEMGTNIKCIGVSAFCNNFSLNNVDRFLDNDSSHTFDTVGNYAFANTNLSSLNLSLRSSSIYTFWGDGCFQNCNNLKNVHFLSANYMSKDMFKDCKQLSSVQFDVPLMAYTYPSVFDGCENLVSICLPSQLLFIPEYMFNECYRLTSLTFTSYYNSSIDEIQRNAFNNCRNIKHIEFPDSINSLNKLHPMCLSNMNNLSSLKFNGIGSAQILSSIPYNIMNCEHDSIRLNEWYTFNESYYGLYQTFDDYINSSIDIYDDEDGYYAIDEETYERQHKIQNANYVTIDSIISAAKDKNIPIVLAISICDELGCHGYGNFITTQQDMLLELNYSTDYSCYKPGEKTPSFFISAIKAGTKTFSCKYVVDYELQNAYLCPYPDDYMFNLDTEWYSTSYINLVQKYVEYGQQKQQLSAIFISYTLNIGDFPTNWDEIYDKYYVKEAYNMCRTEILKYIQNRLNRIRKSFDKKILNNSIFKYINENFYNTLSGINTNLGTYDNYGIIITQLNTKTNIKTKVKLPSDIYYYDHITDIGFNIIDQVNDYCFKNDVSLSSQYDRCQYMSLEEYCISSINNICTSELEKLRTSTNKYKYTQLNNDYSIINTDQKLNDISILNKYNFVNDILSSGCFGLKHDVEIQCDEYNIFDEPIKLKYTYDSNKYVEPDISSYSSNKTETSNFKVGKWYYNAREIYNYAKEHHIPCLFIYSLLGCGPCSTYQKILWNNPEFQEWFDKQKFLLCGLECESQPIYDDQLKFLVDYVSTSALNFAKEDIGETLDSKQNNQLNQKFRQYKTDDNRLASSLMTPVLIFMDKDGNCWDYTYHYINRDVQLFGVNGLLQQLKSLCLCHFDNNSLTSPRYVVDACIPFNSNDYKILNINYPFMNDNNIIDMSYFYITSTLQAESDIKNKLGLIDFNVGGCEFSSIKYLEPIYMNNYEILDKPNITKSELNSVFNNYSFKIQNNYYKLLATGDAIIRVDRCGDTINAYKLEWVLIEI